MKLGPNVCLDNIEASSNMGHVGLTTRSPDQILSNTFLHSRGQIDDLLLMKHDQNVCLRNI